MEARVTVTAGRLGGEDSEHIGLIELKLRRVVKVGESEHTGGGNVHGLDIGLVHESSKKAGAHCIRLGEAKVHKVKRIRTRTLDKQPYATFIFRFRSKEMLQAQGIMPRSVEQVIDLDQGKSTTRGRDSPVEDTIRHNKQPRRTTPDDAVAGLSSAVEEDDLKPRTIKDEDDDEGDEDFAVLKSQFDLMQKSMMAFKAKMDRAEAKHRRSSGSKMPLKREASPIRLGSSASGGVIDLTDD
ncbi:hypothetical protein A0H81_12562 [Grifola frondosa]|uniref:DUF7918 domain-containing protein n=1 Tax=Grifola frondosa TaxID=5627 RepID=A0A1C7LRQ2_GRIFR|nr:hypothetical protein A0H81_12562 [Grifola frondosa]